MKLAFLRSLAGLLLTLALPLAAQSSLKLLPYPRNVQLSGGSFALRGKVKIAVDSRLAADHFAASLLQKELSQIDNLKAQVHSGKSKGGAIVLLPATSKMGIKLSRKYAISLPAAAQAEGYALVVTAKRAYIIAPSSTGLFYGVETLRQLLHPQGAHGAAAPALVVTDWPALRWRGVSVDISRGPVPTLAAMKRAIALLAEFKVNVYSLYMEDNYAYRTLPVGPVRGGSLNASEAAELVRFAAQYHVNVLPEQESFGHLHMLLRNERFQNLAELPYGDVLSPAAPGSLPLIGKLFGELSSVFPFAYLHVGADETFQLGEGRSWDMAEREGTGELFIQYLKGIHQQLAPLHRKLLFWGDIAVKHPELLSQLPKDMVAVPWVYDPRPSYMDQIRPFRQAGLQCWVSPGVSNWRVIYPDYTQALPNIRQFTADGKAGGCEGLLNTTWMDDGENLFGFTWYGLLYGAAAGWQQTLDDQAFRNAYDWALYRADGHHFEGEVEKLTAIHAALHASPLHARGRDRFVWLDPFSPEGQKIYSEMLPAAHQVRLLAEDVSADLAQNRNRARRNSGLLDYTGFAAQRFDYLGQKAIYAIYIRQLYDHSRSMAAQKQPFWGTMGRIEGVNGLIEDMRDDDVSLRARYSALWLRDNRPYFLGDILVRYDRELNLWEREAQRMHDAEVEYGATHQFPPLVQQPAQPGATGQPAVPPPPPLAPGDVARPAPSNPPSRSPH